MGILRNHLLKTAIKQNLADLTHGVESLQHGQEGTVSFGEAVIMMSRHGYYQPYLESGELAFMNWEQCFLGMVMIEVKRQLEPNRSLIYGTRDHTAMVDLVSSWIEPYGGNPDEMRKLYSGDNNRDRSGGNSEVHPCPFCQTKIRIPVPPPAQKARCKGCNSRFNISYDGTNCSLSR